MRLLILGYEFPPLGGGAGNATAELVRSIESYRDMEVVVVTSSEAEARVDRHGFTANSEIHYVSVGKSGRGRHYQTNLELGRYVVAAHRLLRQLVKQQSFDCCHAVMTVPAGINAWLLRHQCSYIVSLQGSDVPGFSGRYRALYPILRPMIRQIWRDSKGVVANSGGLRDLALRSAPRQAIDVIPNGIDTDKFRPVDRSEQSEDLRIICVGRLIERKGVRELVDAFRQVIARVPAARLDLVGEGKLEDEMRARVAGYGLEHAVVLHGAVAHDRLPQLLHRAAVFALPSHWEGMSNALAEGIACGLPVVVTDTGGTAELVDGNGRVVPVKDVDALAAALIELLADDTLRRQMGEESRRIALRYSWQTMTASYVRLYETAMLEAPGTFARRLAS